MDYRKILIICFVIAGCNEVKDCALDENRRLALVEFYRYSDLSVIDTLVFERVTSPQSPYLFYNIEDTLLTAMYFPLNPEADTSEFILETDSAVYDLDFIYQSSFTVYDVDCDPSIKFFNLTCSSLAIDSLAIENPVLNREELTNVKVYL